VSEDPSTVVTGFYGDSLEAAPLGAREAIVFGEWFIQHSEIGIEDI
jgi:hypothetical protein